MNKHSEPLFQNSNFSPPGCDKFSELLHYTPKNSSIVLRSREERNTDFVSQFLPLSDRTKRFELTSMNFYYLF